MRGTATRAVKEVVAREFKRYTHRRGKDRQNIGCFSAEFGVVNGLRIYSGGLGELAGSTLKSAEDLGLPLIGVGLLYRDGYFRQQILGTRQTQQPQIWEPTNFPGLVDLFDEVGVPICGQDVRFRRWGFKVNPHGEDYLPLILLDSLGASNPHGFEDITRGLYMGGTRERLRQEMALGIGGVRALDMFGIPIAYYHLNEGHAAFAIAEVLSKFGRPIEALTAEDFQKVAETFSFTTHTPVPAGFDLFHRDEIIAHFSDLFQRAVVLTFGADPANRDFVNMARLAMRFSGKRNAVSGLHAAVSEAMFPEYCPIIPITNGVHHLTWTTNPMAAVYDEYFPDWRKDPTVLSGITEKKRDPALREKLWAAHMLNKRRLIDFVKEKTGERLSEDVFTVGVARRFATYKRGDLPFHDEAELLKIAQEMGGLQLVFAGKAHPADEPGKDVMEHVIQAAKRSKGKLKVVFLEDYDLDMAGILTAGCDLWGNFPLPPREASGTSGMKAAANAVPHLSTPDGWWAEAQGGGYTIGNRTMQPSAEDPHLYIAHFKRFCEELRKGGGDYRDKERFLDNMAEAVANFGFFNSHRMVKTYLERVWRKRIVAPFGLPEKPVGPEGVGEMLKVVSTTAYSLARAKTTSDVEEIVAKGLIKGLRATRVTRYDAHNESVRIDRRWEADHFGGIAHVESRRGKQDSGFDTWRHVEKFSGEVMADVLRTGKAQVVLRPHSDPRCKREGKLVSAYPFILIPEVVNGVICGAYKIDLPENYALESAHKVDYVDALITAAGRAKSGLLADALKKDFSAFVKEETVINWALTLLTAGGFTDMPRYAVETNRAAVFLANSRGDLVGAQAIGDVNNEQFMANLARFNADMYKEGVERFLRQLDQSRASLNVHIKGENIGTGQIPIPVNVTAGSIIFDSRVIEGRDIRPLAALKGRIDGLFAIDGNPVANYIIVPLLGEDGRVIGIAYLDNAFSRKSLSVENSRAIVEAAAERIIELRKIVTDTKPPTA